MSRLEAFANATQFRAHVSALPEWDTHVDDDPNWVRPTHEVTGQHPVAYDALLEHAKKQVDPASPPPLTKVPVHAIRQTQQQVNLLAVKHYVDHPAGDLYDPDSWLGTPHPVVVHHPDHGFVIADGNSRFSAALIRGDREMSAHVVPGVSRPDHREAVEAHARDTAAAGAAHTARVAALKAEHGGTASGGPNAHPAVREGAAASYKRYAIECHQHNQLLKARLSR